MSGWPGIAFGSMSMKSINPRAKKYLKGRKMVQWTKDVGLHKKPTVTEHVCKPSVEWQRQADPGISLAGQTS